jgi:uncharacterized protein (TIGR00725 family)
MKLRLGVMGSAATEIGGPDTGKLLSEKAEQLAYEIARRDVVLLTGATTGMVYLVGQTAHKAGALHVGISPASNELEHVETYKLPTDACDVLIYTGFGLKGRNVVLVRSCDVVVFISGSMGSLNEFTIAHDESKIIGCLTGTGGVADESEYLLQRFAKRTHAQVFRNDDPVKLLDACLAACSDRNSK